MSNQTNFSSIDSTLTKHNAHIPLRYSHVYVTAELCWSAIIQEESLSFKIKDSLGLERCCMFVDKYSALKINIYIF